MFDDHLRNHGSLRTAAGACASVDEVRVALGSWRTVAASVPLGQSEMATLMDAIDG